jgi:hypothetical protein
MATHTGVTTDAFAETVADWIATARHPRFQRNDQTLIPPLLPLAQFLKTAFGY